MFCNTITELAIIGNAPGAGLALVPGIPFIRFNLPADTPLESNEIRVCNSKVRRACPPFLPFVVQSNMLPPVQILLLQDKLANSVIELSTMLGCFPSTGLAMVYTFRVIDVSLKIYRMPLCPSMLRPMAMPHRQPLASAFHNWLGERRVAFHWLKESLPVACWPDLWLPCDEELVKNFNCVDPYPALLAWLTNSDGNPEKKDLGQLKKLSQLPVAAWCQYAEMARLERLEKYFFLLREQQETENWWLYRNDLSPMIDTLMHKLMLAQQHLASLQQAG